MGAIPTSPTVVFIEKDNSAYPPSIESSIVGIVGYATKGPTDKPTLITSRENLLQTFGNPSEALQGQGLEGAMEILETTNQVRYVRAVSSDARDASAIVPFGVCPAIKFNTSSFGVNNNLYLKVSVRDSEGTLVLDEQLFSVPSSTANVNAGLTQASAIAKIVGQGTSKTDHVSIAFDSNTTDGYIVGAYPGRLAQLVVSAFSSTALTTAALAPSAFFTVAPNTGVGTVGSSTATVYGADILTSGLAYLVRSQYPGTGYNLSTVGITGQTVGYSVEIESNGQANSIIGINEEGAVAETFNASLLDNTTFVEDIINVGTTNVKSNYIKGEIIFSGSTAETPNKLTNFLSQITNTGLTEVGLTLNSGTNVLATTAPRFVKFKDGTYSLSGGTNGGMGSQVIIGNAATKTGMYALDDDLLNISIGIIPGIHDDEVQNAFITLAETSQNFIAAVAPPYGFDTVEEATDWMNGRDTTRTAPINSSWAAVFWPHVQVFDVFSGKDRWYDPAIFAVRQMAFTDNVSESWFAPAGFRRGRLTKPTSTERSLNQGDRDALYVNNINPIVNFVPEGITIFGQKTAQRAATALDRINVRRLMIYLRKVLLQTGRQDLFEPNDAFTWDIIKTKAEAVLNDIQARRGITNFRVICDSTVNTPLRVDRNELWCKILIRPTKTAEWIVFEVNLTSQSAKFSG